LYHIISNGKSTIRSRTTNGSIAQNDKSGTQQYHTATKGDILMTLQIPQFQKQVIDPDMEMLLKMTNYLVSKIVQQLKETNY